MKRRTFLLSAPIGIAGFCTWNLVRNSDVDVLAGVVRRRLDYLQLEPEGVLQFAKDISELAVISKNKLRTLAAINPIYNSLPLSSADTRPSMLLRHGEDRVVSTYLISSDFFVNGMNEKQLVRYLGMLNPLRACSNPFARRPENLS
jgi:hypothetical protein